MMSRVLHASVSSSSLLACGCSRALRSLELMLEWVPSDASHGTAIKHVDVWFSSSSFGS